MSHHHVASWDPSSRRPCSPVSPRSRSSRRLTPRLRERCRVPRGGRRRPRRPRPPRQALPTAAQTTAASSLGGLVRWNRFGTPASISKPEGNLGTASSSDAVTSARAWLGAHADLFGLTPAQIGSLDLVSSQPLAGSDARAVLFRQDFGGPPPRSTAW